MLILEQEQTKENCTRVLTAQEANDTRWDSESTVVKRSVNIFKPIRNSCNIINGTGRRRPSIEDSKSSKSSKARKEKNDDDFQYGNGIVPSFSLDDEVRLTQISKILEMLRVNLSKKYQGTVISHQFQLAECLDDVKVAVSELEHNEADLMRSSKVGEPISAELELCTNMITQLSRFVQELEAEDLVKNCRVLNTRIDSSSLGSSPYQITNTKEMIKKNLITTFFDDRRQEQQHGMNHRSCIQCRAMKQRQGQPAQANYIALSQATVEDPFNNILDDAGVRAILSEPDEPVDTEFNVFDEDPHRWLLESDVDIIFGDMNINMTASAMEVENDEPNESTRVPVYRFDVLSSSEPDLSSSSVSTSSKFVTPSKMAISIIDTAQQASIGMTFGGSSTSAWNARFLPKTTESPVEIRINNEVNAYYDERVDKGFIHPVDFMTGAGEGFKRMRRYMEMYMSIPAGSCTNESLNSIMGDVVTRLRSCLTAENVSHLEAIRGNKHILDWKEVQAELGI